MSGDPLKMILKYVKSSAFLHFGWFCCLWTLCIANAFAQEKKSPEQKVIVAASPEILKPEMGTRIPAIAEKSYIEKPGIARHGSAQIVESRETISSENENTAEKNVPSNPRREAETGSLKYKFHLNDEQAGQTPLSDSAMGRGRRFLFSPSPIPIFDNTRNFVSPDDPANTQNGTTENFRWRAAIGQSLMFLAIQHGYAITQPKTREALKGKFWKDYALSVRSLHGWDDGGRFFTNYIAHPMQGSFTGFIYVQNDPKGLKQQFGTSGVYWRSRLKAMAWSAAWSTQFEIGPVSQASIGNVGLKNKQTWGDIVVTPTIGTAILVTEDAIDRFVMQHIERRVDNFFVRIFARMLLSPTRTVANLFRFKTPWYRDRPPVH